MVYSTSLTLCYFVLVFSVLLALRLPRLGKRTLILVFSYVCSICACLVLSVSSSSLCLGRAAVCNCGTPWTFLLPFFGYYVWYKEFAIFVLQNHMVIEKISMKLILIYV